MGAGRPLSDAAARGCGTARAQLARSVQRAALRGEDGRALAVDAQRPATLGGRLPAGAALAGGRLLRAAGRRSAGVATPGLWTFARAERGHPRQPDPALDARERRAGRL